jgi:hypothetical protein
MGLEASTLHRGQTDAESESQRHRERMKSIRNKKKDSKILETPKVSEKKNLNIEDKKFMIFVFHLNKKYWKTSRKLARRRFRSKENNKLDLKEPGINVMIRVRRKSL